MQKVITYHDFSKSLGIDLLAFCNKIWWFKHVEKTPSNKKNNNSYSGKMFSEPNLYSRLCQALLYFTGPFGRAESMFF